MSLLNFVERRTSNVECRMSNVECRKSNDLLITEGEMNNTGKTCLFSIYAGIWENHHFNLFAGLFSEHKMQPFIKRNNDCINMAR